ncbi:MAG TPA: glycosyltransferase family 4 protein, partial [Candidatus Binatia bacterium]
SFKTPPTGVEFLGFVSDLKALYKKTRLVCCPIQSGGGTRVKILEAASYGVPVVTTQMGAEGLKLAADTEILIRNDAGALAEACRALLIDYNWATSIGAAARERVRTLYCRDAVIDEMKSILTRVPS